MSSSVFVYGTLKPGERNHGVIGRGGSFSCEEAHISGFDIYHFHPENYPGILQGDGVVHGWIITYSDISKAMPYLDELEGTSMEPPLYNRVLTIAQPQGTPVWVYVYGRPERCRQPSARRVASGNWSPEGVEEGLYP